MDGHPEADTTGLLGKGPQGLHPGQAIPAPQVFSFSSYKPPHEATHAAHPAHGKADREATLRRAAEYFLPSSSEDSEDEGVVPRKRTAAPIASPCESPTGSSDRSDSVHEPAGGRHRKDKKRKRTRHKERRRGKESAEVVTKRPKTDAEKVAKIEARVAKDGLPSRRAPVASQTWWGEEVVSREPFYIDSRGDADNLAYEGLYRFHVPAFQRVDPQRVAEGARPTKGYAYAPRGIGAEVDDDRQQGAKSTRNRFFLALAARRERNPHLRRLRLARPRATSPLQKQEGLAQRCSRLALPAPAFIPVVEPPFGDNTAAEAVQAEDAEQYARRRTAEFNVATRERPWDLQLWLDFAAFQDQLAGVGPTSTRRGLAAGLAEKKISILEAALTHHPGSDQLLLALLDTAKGLLDRGVLQERWEKVLERHYGSARLWRAYLQWRRGEFRDFLAADVRECHSNAMRALAREAARREREGAPPEIVEETLRALIATLVEACRLDLQSGNSEQALARLQAALEYNLFSPPFPPGQSAARLRCFEAFWESGAPLIGEEAASGWATWQLRRMGGLPAASTSTGERDEKPVEEEEEGGGWTGWVQQAPLPDEAPPPGGVATIGEDGAPGGGSGEGARGSGDGDEEGGEDKEASPEPGEIGEEETEEELLARLGMKLEAELAALTEGGGVPDHVAAMWADEERSRDARNFLPLRSLPDAQDADDVEPQHAAEEDALRVVLFDDIQDCLFPLGSESLHAELAYALLDLLGAPLGPWRSTFDPYAADSANGTDYADPAMLGALRDADPSSGTNTDDAALRGPLREAVPSALPLGGEGTPADHVADDQSWLLPPAGGGGAALWFQASEERRAFLARALALLVEGPLRGSCRAASALLVVESLNSPDEAVGALPIQPAWQRGRDAAQALLARSTAQHSMPMWNAYAQMLADAKQYKAARKVFDKCLAALLSMPKAYAEHAPLLALPYARMEEGSKAKDSLSRALHVLTWFGCGGPYNPLPSGGALPSDDRVLEARRGYQSMLSARMAASGGLPDEAASAVVEAAGLFELLVGRMPGRDPGQGLCAATAIYQHATSAAPLELRRRSVQLEQLQISFCRLLVREAERPSSGLAPGRAHGALSKALQVYPRSLPLRAMLAEAERRAHTVQRLRRELREACQAAPSAALFLLAAKWEARLPAGAHRVQALFERAVGLDETRQSPLLWRAYIAYEASQGRPDAAGRVFLRAINACPWAKAIWLDGIAGAGVACGPHERKELISAMGAKELRVRTDVFEVLLTAVRAGGLVSCSSGPGAATLEL